MDCSPPLDVFLETEGKLPMHVLVAPGKFRTMVKASALADAIARGLKRAIASLEVTLMPLPSAGLGSMDIVVRALGGRVRREQVLGPFGRPADARWAMLPGRIAWIDAAEVIGLGLKTPHRDATRASSRALGELLQQVLRYQPEFCYVTMGDTIVNDGGIGLLEAFHVHFYDDQDNVIAPGTAGLERLARVDFQDLTPPSIPVVGLYPHPYPASGDSGTTIQFGMEKGVPEFRIPLVDAAMQRYGEMLETHVSMPLTASPGAGAGGALGLALGFLGAQLGPGVATVAQLLHLEQRAASCDWVVTLDEHIDKMSRHGVAGEVARCAQKVDRPVVVLTEAIGNGYEFLYDRNVWGIYPWLDRPRTPKESVRATTTLVEQASFRVGMWMRRMDPRA